MAIELTITIKAEDIDEALDCLTGVYLRTENEELMRQCEEQREKLASYPCASGQQSDVPHGTEREVLQDSDNEETSDENNVSGSGK